MEKYISYFKAILAWVDRTGGTLRDALVAFADFTKSVADRIPETVDPAGTDPSPQAMTESVDAVQFMRDTVKASDEGRQTALAVNWRALLGKLFQVFMGAFGGAGGGLFGGGGGANPAPAPAPRSNR